MITGQKQIRASDSQITERGERSIIPCEFKKSVLIKERTGLGHERFRVFLAGEGDKTLMENPGG